jgi:antitoxin HicB
MVTYPVILESDDNDTLLVSFPDFPEAHTFGATHEEAIARARDALATVIDGYIRSRRRLPAPSRTRGNYVQLPAIMSLKVELYRAMLAGDVTKSELARRLQVHPPQVDRLLDLRHHSRLDQLEAAAAALGLCVEISLASPETVTPKTAPLIDALRDAVDRQRRVTADLSKVFEQLQPRATRRPTARKKLA